jgi:hypothetical protein
MERVGTRDDDLSRRALTFICVRFVDGSSLNGAGLKGTESQGGSDK